ncbi:hypothetical protein ACJRO7_007791, partial [Eucalyptus globulus]
PTVPSQILNKLNLWVLNISLPDFLCRRDGMISVNLPIIYSPYGSCGGNRSFTPVSLNRSHFVFSESRNVFTAVGCNVCALLDDTKSAIIGCKSVCEKDDKFVRKMTCSGNDGCYHTTITSDLQAFSITFQPNTDSTKNKCEYAFLGDRSHFIPSTTNFNKLNESGRFPAKLQWGIAKSSRAALEIYKYGLISGDSYCWNS